MTSGLQSEMPKRPDHIPNATQRQAMQFIRAAKPNISSFVGRGTIINLLEKGWIEPVSPGHKEYRVTPAGEVAIKAKIPG
jgi:hypothetical protein